MSNFSFSHSVFKRLVSQGRQKVSLSERGKVHVFLIWTNLKSFWFFRVYVERNCRAQIECELIDINCLWNSHKHCGEKSWSLAFPFFFNHASTGLFLRDGKMLDYLIKFNHRLRSYSAQHKAYSFSFVYLYTCNECNIPTIEISTTTSFNSSLSSFDKNKIMSLGFNNWMMS